METYLVDGEELPFHSYSDVGSASDPLLVRELKNRTSQSKFLEGYQDPRNLEEYTTDHALHVGNSSHHLDFRDSNQQEKTVQNRESPTITSTLFLPHDGFEIR
jgi:hypothetical protein